MKTTKDIYIMIRQGCCFGSCERWQGVQAFIAPCCYMTIIAEKMVLDGDY